jgi:hypothetical protein
MLLPHKKAPHKSFLGERIQDDFHSVLLQKIVSSLVVRNAMSIIVVQNGLLTLFQHHQKSLLNQM